jgi:hypothetical protein
MNSSPAKQRLLLAAGWIGTAFIAYSIGSFHSPPSAPMAATAASETNGASGFDPSVLGLASERPLDGAHGSSTRTLSEVLGTQPLNEYLKRILTLEDDIKRTSAFLEVLETLKTPEQIREALEAVAKSGRGWGRGVSSREFSMLLQKWTGLDPKGAAEYAVKANGRDERFVAMSNVLRTWTRQDPNSALAWAQANGVHASNDPNTQQRAEGDGNYAVAMVVSQLARTDVDLALRVASADGDSRSATRLADTLANELYRQHGEEAARTAIMAMPESKLRDAMIGEHADRLADTDSPGAAQWASTLPNGPGRSRALAEAIDEWANDDPSAAGNFLNNLPPSADSDAARERFARNVLDKDPVGALSWANTITDTRERQETTERLVRSWVRRDAETAKNWVMQGPFSDETKQRLLTPDTRGRN